MPSKAEYIIKGQVPLRGELEVAGNKNAILPIMAATLLTDQECQIDNVPLIEDVQVMAEILKDLGATVEGLKTKSLLIKTSGVNKFLLKPSLVERLRASILFLGPLLARFGQAELKHPGGCLIGRRAVGTHFQALEKLGAVTMVEEQNYKSKLKNPKAGRIFLGEASVTATENALMLASLIPGETTIVNAACEPHVRNLAQLLSQMGANIQGAGTNQVTIQGVKKLKGARIEIVPDYMEIGTYAIAAAITNGSIRISGVEARDLEMILLYLKRMGVRFKLGDDFLKVDQSQLIAPKGKIQTRPWPGFPTDLMSPLIVLATQAEGTTLCHEWMYETRMFFVDKLVRMGADIVICDPHRVLVTGPTTLRGKELESPDIRAGMALVLAALCAQGESRIKRVDLVERGYEEPEKKLKKLGARIEKVTV